MIAPETLDAGVWDELAARRGVYWAPGRTIADRVRIRVRKAEVPAILYPKVEVRREKVRTLGLVERQALRVAAHLGDVSADDLTTLTGLPETVGRLVVARLANGGLLALEGDRRALLPAGRAALARPTVVESRTESMAFAVLPRTGDVLPADRGGLAGALKLKAVSQAPVPAALRAATPVDVLRAAFSATPALFGAEAVEVVAAGAAGFPALCGAFTVEGEVVADGDHEVARLHLRGAHSSHGVDLEHPTVLVEGWRALAAHLSTEETWADALCAFLAGTRPHDFTLTSRAPCAYELGLPGPLVRGLVRAGIGLESARSLVVKSHVAEVEARVHFRWLDDEGAAAFLLDAVASRIAGGGLPNTPATYVDVAGPLGLGHLPLPSPDAVRRRLWQLEAFPAVYRLREPEDFPDDR